MYKPKFYLTNPVYDAVSEPDIDLLYTAVLCDVVARHKRMCGFDVAAFIGVDTHQVHVDFPPGTLGPTRAAEIQGNYRKFVEFLNRLDVRGTHFQRTHTAEHALGVEALLRRILRRSRHSIYRDRYQGRFCPHDQIDVSESAEPAECPTCGRAAVLVSEDRHFFRLSAFRDRLLALYKYHPEFIQPQFQLEEVRRLVMKGLKDMPISRKSDGNGVRWPDDPNQIVVERFRGLVSYLSAIGFGEGEYGNEEFRRYWPPNLHVVGKEALWSHAVAWPAFLMAADLSLPRHIFTHGTLSMEEEAKGRALFSEPNLQSRESDALRYCLLRQVSYGENARISGDDLFRCCNSDLIEGLASLANQVLTLVARHCHGKVPSRSLLDGVDRVIETDLADVRAEVRFLMDTFNFSEALQKIRSLVATTDKLLKYNARFESADDPSEKRHLGDVLHDACEGLGWIVLLLHPILPRVTDRIWKSLGQTARLEDQLIDDTPWCCLMPDTPVNKIELLFPAPDNLPNLAAVEANGSFRSS
jgi:methionyl-tRNA synthetase